MPEVESKSGAESLPSDPETDPEIVGQCCCVNALLKDKGRCAKVKELKQVLGGLSLREQNQMLFGLLRRMHMDSPGEWRLFGQSVHRGCWVKLLGVGNTRIGKIKRAVLQGKDGPFVDGRAGGAAREYPRVRREDCDKFFVWAWHFLGEPLVEGEFDDEKKLLKVNPPVLAASNAITVEQMYRETILSRDPVAVQSSLQQKFIRPLGIKELYGEYKDWHDNYNKDEPYSCMYTFRQTYHQWVPKTLKPRDKLQHGRCKACAEYAQWRKEATSEEQKQRVLSGYLHHLQGMYADRTVYSRTCALGEAATSAYTQGALRKV